MNELYEKYKIPYKYKSYLNFRQHFYKYFSMSSDSENDKRGAELRSHLPDMANVSAVCHARGAGRYSSCA